MNLSLRIFVGLVGAFLVLLPLQFLFAGYGVFSGDFDTHEIYGGVFLHALVLTIVIAAAIARQWRLFGLALALFIMVFVQIGLAAAGRENDQPWVGALHPFIAFCYWPYAYFLLWKPARDAAVAAPRDRDASKAVGGDGQGRVTAG